MKINEIINEDVDPATETPKGLDAAKPNETVKAGVRDLLTFPAQNMAHGSAYVNYRFGIALAGAPDFPAAAEPFIGGDPVVVPYTQADMDMVNKAAEYVGDHSKKVNSSHKSAEISGTNKQSPVAKPKKNKYGV